MGKEKWKLLKKRFFSIYKIRHGRILLGIGFFVFMYLFLLFSVLPFGVSVELGKPSPRKIIAQREVIDSYTTNALREEAALAVPEVFDHDHKVLEEGKATIANFFTGIKKAEGLGGKELEDQIAFLNNSLEQQLPKSLILALLSNGSELDELQLRVEGIYEGIMSQGIKENGVQAALGQALREINLLPFKAEVKQGMEKLLSPLIKPNMLFNAKSTKANREAAKQAIEPVRILKNSLIVQEGERVTEKHIAQLQDLGLLGNCFRIGGYLGLFFILIILFIIVLSYLYLFNRDIYEHTKNLTLLGLIIVLTLLFGLAARYFSGYLMPIGMGCILITVLFEPRLAVLVNIVMALLVGIIAGGEFKYIVVAIFGGLVAIYSVSQLQRRSDLTRAGIYLAAANVVAIVAVILWGDGFQFEYDFLRGFSIAIFAGLGNGFFSAIMAIGLLPYLESAFGLTTAVTLLELADPGRPLLRKLLVEAPGTYHHSIVVGNLAEAAAEAVDADPLLSRVGAFYHDIGKTKRPYFFVENQFTGDNPHKKITPNLSALIIRSHVKDGLELAKEEKLPLPVLDIIQQHHGTTLVSFFYQRALENLSDKDKMTPDEKEFRYEGPLPQTKEAAIILLADAVEAAVRSLSRPVAGRIEGMVRRIIKEKLNDGQFDEAPLTLKDLDKIGDTFVHILSGIFHQRIEYPEKELKVDLERGKSKDGSAGK
ncbi:MAG: HD family phosphohydrolase [Dethiobacteria bacterium]|jgi:putative nucleotidyltransferase with HDIG domain